MISWKEIPGNEIKMFIVEEDREVVGTIYEGYRYKDGIVSIHGYDGKDYAAFQDSWTIGRTKNTLPDICDENEDGGSK